MLSGGLDNGLPLPKSVEELIDAGIIVRGSSREISPRLTDARGKRIAGLSNAHWRFRPIPNSNIRISLHQRVFALIDLASLAFGTKIYGIQYVIRTIQRCGNRATMSSIKTGNHATDIAELCAAIEWAKHFMPAKIDCLLWAGALVIGAIRSGVAVKFVIGVQHRPFVAHAWAETITGAISENPDLSSRMAVLLELSFPVSR
ncbi:lasso peptide biosynthesis B2 protein [Methylosinus sporium]|nr:lasso peptide biosynthesis B2 protein [Methylosinus sporium]